MRRSLTLLACGFALLGGTEAYGAHWDTVVFREDFNALDSNVWVISHPDSPDRWWWTQGRTHFPDPDMPTPPPSPRIGTEGADTFCVIEHHLFNPYDSSDPNEWFLGAEIHSIREFEANRRYRIDARLRLHEAPNGLVAAFFLYGDRTTGPDTVVNDEIDVEFSTNGINNDGGNFPNGDPVITNSYNDASSDTDWVATNGLDASVWNTYRIYWSPKGSLPDPEACRIDWYWVESIDPETQLETETWLRTQTDCSHVPDEPMALFFNYWSPCYTGWGHNCDPWDGAADPGLTPVNDPQDNETYEYDIDYVEVRVSSLDVPSLSASHLTAMAVLIVVLGGLILRRRLTPNPNADPARM